MRSLNLTSKGSCIPTSKQNVEHNGRKLEIKIATYSDRNPAIYLLTEAGSIYETLSVPCPDWGVVLGQDEFIAKSWEPLWDKVKHLFINTGRMCNVGGIPTTPIYRLSKPKPIFVVIADGVYQKTFWTREEAQRYIRTMPPANVYIVDDYIN